MKRKLLFLLCMVLVGFTGASCLDDETSEIAQGQIYPLMSFSVAVNDTYYHGKIDQASHRVEVGGIVDLYSITGVDYTLQEGATISPDPSTFVGQWAESQTVTVTSPDGTSTTYTIVMTRYDESLEGVIFHDDFNVDGTPDPTKWRLCDKATSDWNYEMSESYDQAYVQDGVLVLVAEKVGDQYLAGGIETQGLFDFTFGKVEVRARITSYPDGAFPAIWMMPSQYIYNDWPYCGEIDIMEHIGQDAGIYSSIHNRYYDIAGIDDPAHTSGMTPVDDITAFHTYAVEWTADELIFSIDGVETFTYPNLHLEDEATQQQWPFTEDSKFYLILNMGLGDTDGTHSGTSWAGPVDDSGLPAIMEVDWVRVYEPGE